MSSEPDPANARKNALNGVDPLFVERWSPRSFDGTAIDPQTLALVFEAARWSPSCFNEQPWHFHTSTPATFDDFLALLQEGNQVWARTASLIGFITGRTRFAKNDKDNRSFAFDCGAAWMAMTFQARMLGLYTHAMAGIHYDRVAEYLQIDNDKEQVLAGFVIGRKGEAAALPDNLRAKEAPSDRHALDRIWTEHTIGKP